MKTFERALKKAAFLLFLIEKTGTKNGNEKH